MARRYYLSKVIKDVAAGRQYVKIADYEVNYAVAAIPTGPDGWATRDWTLVVVDTPNHAQLLSDPDIRALPDFPLDGRIAALSVVGRRGIDQALARFGIPADRLNDKEGYREMIRSIGRELDPAFDENQFDVSA